METLLKDFRYSIRTLNKRPGFTIVAVIALALGIGANTAIFSVVNAVLFRSLPYDEPDRLVWLWEFNKGSNVERERSSLPNFVDWRDQNQSFEEVGGFTPWMPALMEGEPERIKASRVSHNFFSTLRAKSALGRTFEP